MKLRWLIPVLFFLPLRIHASGQNVSPQIATITIDPKEVTVLHLRPEFVSTVRMPEEVTSVVLGSPGSFKAEHNEGEPQYVYIKPITKKPAQSNLLIVTRSGQHVTLELISDGADLAAMPVDFLIEYRAARGFLISSDVPLPAAPKIADNKHSPPPVGERAPSPKPSSLDEEFEQQMRINAPKWAKWEGKQIETSIGDVRQWNDETAVAYSIFNNSDQPVEIVSPQIQMTGRKTEKKKKKKGKGIISDQLEIREYKLSTKRLEAGGRADEVVIFDRPNFKQSTEKLFLQIAQADQVDRPILIPLPFTPTISADHK